MARGVKSLSRRYDAVGYHAASPQKGKDMSKGLIYTDFQHVLSPRTLFHRCLPPINCYVIYGKGASGYSFRI